MKSFVETANLEKIREVQEFVLLDGVTIIPSINVKKGIIGKENILKHYINIGGTIKGDSNAEVVAISFYDMISEGEVLAALNSQILIKLLLIA